MMKRALVIDPNLAVLLFVGLSGKNNIRNNKRLDRYNADDFEILARLIESAAELVFSPNVLSETSNLIFYTKGPARDKAIDLMASSIRRSREIYVESKRASNRSEFRRLGMTDSVLLEMLDEQTTLLTDDLNLYLAAAEARKHVINFTHLKQQIRLDH